MFGRKRDPSLSISGSRFPIDKNRKEQKGIRKVPILRVTRSCRNTFSWFFVYFRELSISAIFNAPEPTIVTPLSLSFISPRDTGNSKLTIRSRRLSEKETYIEWQRQRGKGRTPFNSRKNPGRRGTRAQLGRVERFKRARHYRDVIIATRNDGIVARIPRHPAVLRRGNRANHGEPWIFISLEDSPAGGLARVPAALIRPTPRVRYCIRCYYRLPRNQRDNVELMYCLGRVTG